MYIVDMSASWIPVVNLHKEFAQWSLQKKGYFLKYVFLKSEYVFLSSICISQIYISKVYWPQFGQHLLDSARLDLQSALTRVLDELKRFKKKEYHQN